MKKLKKLFIFVLCVLSLFLVTGCSKREALSADTFKSTIEGDGFRVNDALGQFDQYDYVKTAYVAVDSTNSYSIEFYVLSDSSYGKSFFENNKKIFDESDGTKVEVNLLNYEKFSVENSSSYKYLARIDNTVVYVDTDVKNKDSVSSVIEKLGY